MSIKEQLPAYRTSFTFVGVVILCAVAIAYSQGWLDWSRPVTEMEGNQVSINQTADQDNPQEDVVHVTRQTTEHSATPAE